MKRAFLVFILTAGTILACGERCPLEPHRDTCVDLYGVLHPPPGPVFPAREITVRTLGAASGLNRDMSFCLPGHVEDSPGALVATLRDTVPVMLGYVIPEYISDGNGGTMPVPQGDELRSILRDGTGAVKISAASTALGLVMLNPFLGGATATERARFGSRAVRHSSFEDLVEGVTAALMASPEDLCDPEINSDLYEKAAVIQSDVLCLEEGNHSGEGEGAPYVLDGAGELIDVVNPTTVHYGMRVAGEGAVSADSVLLLAGRDIHDLVARGVSTVSQYALGDGRFDIEFYKGFSAFDPDRRLDPEHAGGLATLANADRLLWYALTIPVGCPPIEDPASISMHGAGWIGEVAAAMEVGEMGGVLDLAFEYLCSNPDRVGAVAGGGIPDPVNAVRFLAATRGIVAAGTARLEEAGLAPEMPFYADLFTAVDHESLLVCQRDGSIVPCENAPVLSGGTVLPTAGSVLTYFKFEVDYYDGDGDAPGYIKVCIDGMPGEEMALKAGTSSDGTYCYETALSLGPHEYHFECTDIGGAETRLPDSGTLTGPMVYSSEGKNPDAKVAVHVRAHNAKAGCDYGTIECCHDIVTTCPDFSVDAFPVFFDLTEYRRVEFGLTWPGWHYSAAWYSCSDLAEGEIRWPGDGVTEMWDECRRGRAAVPGYIWVYPDYAGMICVCEHPVSGGVGVFDCSGGMDEPLMWLCAGVYGAAGDDPCPP